MTSSAQVPAFPDEVIAALHCSLCGSSFTLLGRTFRCEQGHTFDLAKQGYINLLHAGVTAFTADTAEMVAARVRFQSANHYGRLADEISRQAHQLVDKGLVVDAGAGTGYYLARLLSTSASYAGLALDVSALALRRAAKAHLKIGAAVWNLWQPWPVKTGCANLILNIFAPRNGAEFHRILSAEGALIVVSPQQDHLVELSSMTDMLTVDERKEERLNDSLGSHFSLVEKNECRYSLNLNTEDVLDVVRMGPNAHHLNRSGRLAELENSLAKQSGTTTVTAAFRISHYRPLKLTT